MLITTLSQDDITWLAYAAGIATGSGNENAQAALLGIIGRAREIEDEPTQVEDLLTEDDLLVEAEDFDGTLDPQFMPPAPSPPSRPQTEFGPGPVTGLA